jgi:hypothetical protein
VAGRVVAGRVVPGRVAAGGVVGTIGVVVGWAGRVVGVTVAGTVVPVVGGTVGGKVGGNVGGIVGGGAGSIVTGKRATAGRPPSALATSSTETTMRKLPAAVGVPDAWAVAVPFTEKAMPGGKLPDAVQWL